MNTSVLIPTRERPKGLCESINSIVGNSKTIDDIEFLVYIDKDDPELLNYQNSIASLNCNVKTIIGERYTYLRLHEYYNKLAEISTGTWLWLFNDDSFLRSKGWEEKLLPYSNKACVVSFHGAGWPLFPLSNRAIYTCLNHLSYSPHNDNYVVDVAHFNNQLVRLEGIQIDHTRDLLQDNIRIENSKLCQITSPTYNSAETQELLKQDINALMHYLSFHPESRI